MAPYFDSVSVILLSNFKSSLDYSEEAIFKHTEEESFVCMAQGTNFLSIDVHGFSYGNYNNHSEDTKYGVLA